MNGLSGIESGCFALSGLGLGLVGRVPRALPWAGMLRPLRGEIKKARHQNTRVGGMDINKPRMRAVMEAVIGLSPSPQGFGIAALAARVGEITGLPYQSRQAAYDLKKLRGKGLVRKVEHTRCWEATAVGLKTMAGLVVLREKVIKPLLAGIVGQPGPKPKECGVLEFHYQAIRCEMQSLFQTLKIAV